MTKFIVYFSETLFPYFMIILIFGAPNLISEIASHIKKDDDKYTFGFKQTKLICKPSPIIEEAIDILIRESRCDEKRRVLKNILECRFGKLTNDYNQVIEEMNLFELDILIDHVFTSNDIKNLISFKFKRMEL